MSTPPISRYYISGAGSMEPGEFGPWVTYGHHVVAIAAMHARAEKAAARAEELTHAIARVALDFGADPDILGGLWESSDCIKWMAKVHAALKAKGITIAWDAEDHGPVVMDGAIP